MRLKELTGVSGVLVVELGVNAEIRRTGAAWFEAVVLDEALELRGRDLGLSGFDRVEDGQRLERIGRGGPGTHAVLRLRTGRSVELGVERGGELVPEADVRALLGRMIRAGERRGGLGGRGEREDGAPIFPRIVCELIPRQLTALPARVEGMLEDVASAAGFFEAGNEGHECPFRRVPGKRRS